MSLSSLNTTTNNTIVIPSHRAIDFARLADHDDDTSVEIILASRQLRRIKRQQARQTLMLQHQESSVSDSDNDSVTCPSVESTSSSRRSTESAAPFPMNIHQCRSIDMAGRIVAFDKRLCC